MYKVEDESPPEGKIICETIKLKIWGSEHVPLKRYWRNNLEKCMRAIEKFVIFFNFLQSERSSGLKFWQSSRCLKADHQKFFEQKSVKFEGFRMTRSVVISDWKMIFLQATIENFSILKIISITESDFSKIYSHKMIVLARP